MFRPPSSDRWVEVGPGVIPVAATHAFLPDERAGGTCLFVGTPRRWTGGVETRALDYHAYEEMSRLRLADVLDEAFERWPLVRALALHRLGVVPLREASVVVGAAAPHRAGAFEACRWLIDTVKADVPIWKRDADLSSPLDSAWR